MGQNNFHFLIWFSHGFCVSGYFSSGLISICWLYVITIFIVTFSHMHIMCGNHVHGVSLYVSDSIPQNPFLFPTSCFHGFIFFSDPMRSMRLTDKSMYDGLFITAWALSVTTSLEKVFTIPFNSRDSYKGENNLERKILLVSQFGIPFSFSLHD